MLTRYGAHKPVRVSRSHCHTVNNISVFDGLFLENVFIMNCRNECLFVLVLCMYVAIRVISECTLLVRQKVLCYSNNVDEIIHVICIQCDNKPYLN